MKILPVNRTSTSIVILLICFRFILTALLYIPSLEFAESMGKIPLVFNLLSTVYIFLYLRNFLGEVMKEKGFNIPLLLLALLIIINELLNSVAFSQDLFNAATVISILVVMVDIWLWVKLFMLSNSPYRAYLRWYAYLSIISIIASIALPMVVGHAALLTNIFLSLLSQLPFLSVLLMVLAYQKAQKA